MKKFFWICAGFLMIIFESSNEVNGQDGGTSSRLQVNADIYSNYLWRGTRFGNGPHIQPSVKFVSGGLTAGVWGSFNLEGYSETDPYVSYTFPFGLSMGFTDYYLPDLKLSDISVETGSHAVELNGGFTKGVLSLQANYILNEAGGVGSAGNDLYFQACITFPGFNVFAGAGNGWHTSTGKFNICNLGVGTSKALHLTDKFSVPVTGQVVLNPEKEQLHVVAGISF